MTSLAKSFGAALASVGLGGAVERNAFTQSKQKLLDKRER